MCLQSKKDTELVHVKEEPEDSDDDALNKYGTQGKKTPTSGLLNNRKKRRRSVVISDDSEDECIDRIEKERVDEEVRENNKQVQPKGKKAMLEDEDAGLDAEKNSSVTAPTRKLSRKDERPPRSLRATRRMTRGKLEDKVCQTSPRRTRQFSKKLVD